MVRRCPVCQVILLEVEWQAGHCTACSAPLTEGIATEQPSPEPTVPPTQPGLVRRGLEALTLLALGSVLTLLVVGTGRPEQGDPAPGPTPEAPARPEVVAQVRPPVVLPPAPELVKEPPHEVVPAPQPPAVVVRPQPQPLGKDKASTFAREITTATEILARKHFRELDEDQLSVWAIRGLYEAAQERIPPELEALFGQEGLQRSDLLIEARSLLGDRAELTSPRDTEIGLRAICRRLDPHTIYMDAAAMTRLSVLQNSSKVGELGVVVRRQPGSNRVEVVTPYKDSSAYKAGIRAGDLLTRVRLLDDQAGRPLEQPEELDPSLLAEDDGSAAWGALGSWVEVTVQTPGAEQPRTYVLTRDRVKKERLLGVKRRDDDTWDHVLDAERGIYYVRLTDFHSPDTARALDVLLKSFTQPKLQGLVLDLRFTGSGLIQSAFDVADLFVPNGLIVEFRSRNLLNGKGNWQSRGKAPHAKLPIVCLVNGDAGTCTEIVAAALQDHQRAEIVGERTGGKASAQNYYPLAHGTLRITTSHAYRPSGKPLDWTAAGDGPDAWGVTPDAGCLVPLAAEERTALRERFADALRLSRGEPAKAVRDRQLERALESLVQQLE